jgi:hypothetical protein
MAQIAGCARHQQEPFRRLAAIHRWASAALVPEPERSMGLVVEEFDA